ncbi:hypothetical protein LQW54_009136 [Pestalotiopsis sp. IQ-011]
MDLTPPPLSRSPASSLNTDLPSPGLGDSHYKIPSLYEQACGMDMDHTLEAESMALNTTSSAEWNATLLAPSSSADVPHNILATYDTFTGYDTALHSDYHNIYTTSQAPTAVGSLSPQPFPRTLSHSPAMAQRPFYGYRPSASPQPRVKMESGSSEYPDPEASRYPSPHAGPAMPVEIGGYSSAASSTGYLSDAPSSSMPRSEYGLENSVYPSMSAGQPASHQQNMLPYHRMNRGPRPKTRKLTSKEDANYQCEVKGCGKLFSRSYNYKAHLETHDENREYPFPCTMGDCDRKFVRKTDLTRHHQSVHMREKNHRCDYCHRSFARKDTLRRHMEDGCSKRFDIGTLDVCSSEGYDPSFSPRSSASNLIAPPPTQLPPMTNSVPRSPSTNLLEPVSTLMRRGY